MAQKTVQTGKYLSIFLSVAVFVLLPFIYSERLQDVEQSPRFLVFALVLAISSFALTIQVRKVAIPIQKDKIFIFIALFLLVNFVSFFRSINWGDGLFELLKLFLLYSFSFQMLLLFSWDEKNKFIFFKSIGIGSLIFIGVAITQILPSLSDFINKGSPVRINYAFASSLGNKNFFAETLLMMLPVTLYSILVHRSAWKIFFIVVSVLTLIFIIILQTLSTWLALTVTSAFTLLLLFKHHKKIFSNQKQFRVFYLGVSGSVFLLAIAGIIFFRVTGTSQIATRLETLKQVITASDTDTLSYENSTYERITLWKTSLRMSADYPIAGVGLGNWKIISPSYGTGKARYMASGVIRFVHPHNDFLLLATESGGIGVMIFIAILGLLIFYSSKILSRSGNASGTWMGLLLLTGLLCYIIISMFSMPANRIYPPLMLMFFISLTIASYKQQDAPSLHFGKFPVTLTLLLSLVISLTSIVIGNKRLRSDFHLSAALLHERNNNINSMRRYLEKIDRKYFPLDATATPIAWYYGFSFFYAGEQGRAFELFKEAEKANPYHLMVLNDLGTCYNLSGDPKTAEQLYKKALTIQPAFGDALINLAIIYYNAGQLDSAFSTLVKHKGKFKKESLPVFQTIIMQKAATFTQDSVALAKLSKRFNTQISVNQLVDEIRKNDSGLEGLLQ